MEAEVVDPPIPTLDEHDKAAVSALLIRTVRIDDELRRLEEETKRIYAEMAALKLTRAKGVTAFSVFGFETGNDLWKHVRLSLGDGGYDRAVAIARGVDVPLLKQVIAESERAAEQLPKPAEMDKAPPRIRDAILEYLRGLGSQGAEVREIKKHLLDAYGIETHEKTPGMTLYRLMKDGLVWRKGRVWFYREREPQISAGAGSA